MKKRSSFSDKLSLNKKTMASLNHCQQDLTIRGGVNVITDDICTIGEGCPSGGTIHQTVCMPCDEPSPATISC